MFSTTLELPEEYARAYLLAFNHNSYGAGGYKNWGYSCRCIKD
jgi:hypothetical protein